MNIRDLKANLRGIVLQTSRRTLSEKEMASVTGGGPTICPGGDEGEATPSYSLINGCCCPDDCYD